MGDVLLADALMCNWKVLYSFTQRGVDVVTRINKAQRKADFRRGKRLGKEDHLVRAGVQPGAYHHGSGGKQARNGTTVDQFQRGSPNTRSIPANDRDAGPTPFSNSTAVLRTASGGCRSTSRSGSTESVRTKAT